MRSRILKLKRCEKGAAALEFALVVPAFLYLLFGILEFGLVMHVSSLVENAVHEGARYGVTGSTYEDINTDGLSREQFLEQYIIKRVGRWIYDPADLIITTNVVGNIVDLGTGGAQPDENNGYGGGGQAVTYKVLYKWHILTPLVGPIIGDEEGVFPIRSTVTVKNEDFCGRRNCFGL